MHRVMLMVLAGALLSGVAGCMPAGSPESVSESAGQSPEPALQPAPLNYREVVVRLCDGASEDDLGPILDRLRLTLAKRSSPRIFTLTWEDDRPVEEIVARLMRERSVICGAQPNYRYQTAPQNP